MDKATTNIFIAIAKAFVEILRYIILPTVLVVGVLVLITITIQYFKYGKNIFSSFKPKNTKDARDKILYLTLDKLDVVKRILKLPYLNSHYVLITKSGIFLIYMFLEEGIIEGEENDPHLKLSLGSVNQRPILNPFLKLNEDEKIIKELLPDVYVTKYLVTLASEYINVKTDTNIMKYNDILYKLPIDEIYTEQDVINFSNTLKKANVK